MSSEEEIVVSKPRVLITQGFVQPGDEIDRRLQEAGFETLFNRWHGGRTEEEMIDLLKGIDGVMASFDPFPARVIESADRLKVISRTGVGYDAVDVKAATARGVAVCITPGTNNHSVAEYTIGLILQCARQMVTNLVEIRNGGWTRHLGRDLAGCTLGIVGLGAIGKEVAQRARAFEMQVLSYDLVEDRAFAAQHQVAYAPLEQLLRESDYVALHLLLNDSTYHLINAERLALMKPSAYLINTSRGGVIDTEALCEALKEKRIAGAALDVFEQEPLAANSPLRELDNAYISPHAATWTRNYHADSGSMAAENLINVLQGGRSLCVVNPEALEH